MKTYNVPGTDLLVSRLAFGTASLVTWNKEPIGEDDVANATSLIHTACEQGITLFDHADVYAFGKAESVFGEVLKRSVGLRKRMVIQSKCGQYFRVEDRDAPIRVDLSYGHIVSAVEGSLKRLGTDVLDILLLHAPDPLVEPEEVAEAFEHLHRKGKVRYFGVSNHDAAQIALLKRTVRQPLIANQIQLSLGSPISLMEGMNLTRLIGKSPGLPSQDVSRSGTIEYCRAHDIQIQAWSPLRGVVNPPGAASPQRQSIARMLSELASERNTTPAVIALAWLLRHPARIVPVMGCHSSDRLIENCAADRFTLSREEWYDLFVGATG